MDILWVVSIIMFCDQVSAADEYDNLHAEFTLTPFPIFSAEPMAQDQCRLQFTDNCRSRDTLARNCPDSSMLHISCNSNVTSNEIQQMATAFAKPPLRAVWSTLYDGDQVAFHNFAPVRLQVVGFTLYNCTSIRATGKLSSLRLSNLLDLNLENCYNLKIRRADFSPSPKVRFINFVNTTIQSLETFTFTDLPALRLLSLENGLAQMQTFSSEIRAYLKELHCGVAFEWFRKWWENKHLMKSARFSEVYQIYPFPVGNEPLNKSNIYLPIDCAAKPFPVGAGSIDFKQERFSVNNDLYEEKWQNGNFSRTDGDDRYPEFSIEPLSPEECATQELSDCQQHDCGKDARFQRYAYEVIELYDRGYCNASSGGLERIHRAVTAMTRLPIRPVMVYLEDRSPLAFNDMAEIRKRIVSFWLYNCVQERATRKLHDLYWTNVLEFMTVNCSELVIMKNDFENSMKLRQIFFWNTTIRTLEENTFTNLPSLVALSLQHNLKNLRSFEDELTEPRPPVMFTQRIRDYLFRLHCSCEFAWFRRWWSNNTARFIEIADQVDGAYQFFHAINSWYTFKKDQIPIDCAKPIPMGAEFITANQSEFSINALEC
ncbi:uncharacterized protein LOC129582197 [Paramacrobiotus metropolitanus]|uniref:uncharacterized protein LOC129582197 n=1 Tax=Paramacrobiotus metropolitanus TaxID=2943436 RepID=UPI002445A4E0|nr:uncharacterized protein LOC129582197 [Paramacrobiotus metropolitanus]XP_055329621.1 uncharacterized protein LOC129582197 [Paramacrobiotus metropolitanus]XP_055329622.1 uncharacterized protein LOC129582197 [Paramacrobiotus metropolitanus]